MVDFLNYTTILIKKGTPASPLKNIITIIMSVGLHTTNNLYSKRELKRILHFSKGTIIYYYNTELM